MTENVRAYLEMLRDGTAKETVAVTDKGKEILKYLQDHSETLTWKSKDVAEGMGIMGRSCSGALRKLTSDGFCEKVADKPAVYTLTEKGKNYIIE